MKRLAFLCTSFLSCVCFAQEKKLFTSWQAAVSNNHSAIPFASFSRLAYKDFNPGFSFGPSKNIFHSKHVFLGLRLHYFHLQKVQHCVAFAGEAGYKIELPAGFSFQPNLGAGVMQAFPEGKLFKLNSEGEYVRKRNLGRTQILLLLNERLEKKITSKGLTAFLAYQQILQAPFINEYVPLLPFNSLLIGISIPNL